MNLAKLLKTKIEIEEEEEEERVNLAALLNKDWAASSSATSGITAYGNTGKKSRKSKIKLRSKL